MESAAARLVAAGATRIRTAEPEDMNHYGVVMEDPEGNEFCLA